LHFILAMVIRATHSRGDERGDRVGSLLSSSFCRRAPGAIASRGASFSHFSRGGGSRPTPEGAEREGDVGCQQQKKNIFSVERTSQDDDASRL
jgi:hypothetical protein